MPPAKPSFGPFITAVVSTLFAAGLLIALALKMPITMITCFSVVVPAMTFSAMAIAISMGWIFVSIGRHNIQPRWVKGAAAFITITMLELLILTYLVGTAQQ
jgi:hypothetical protein